MSDDGLASSEMAGPGPKRLVDCLDPRIFGLLTALGFILSIAGYFYLIARYSVNVIVGDLKEGHLDDRCSGADCPAADPEAR